MRWQLADEQAQGVFFADDEIVERHVGTGEFRGLEFLHVNARRIVNEVPRASRMPFRYTINAYRGCSHACTYCLWGDTPVLMADGRTRPIRDLRVGDRVYGTVRQGPYRRYVVTEVLDHWATTKPAFRITLADGTTLVASGDHRFLSNRGWKHVTGAQQGAACRPHLTTRNSLMGTGAFAEAPKHDEQYRLGYLCGIIRVVGTMCSDDAVLNRVRVFLMESGVPTTDDVQRLTAWPDEFDEQWAKGFLAGIFDAEGSCSRGVLRISNADPEILRRVHETLDRFGFEGVVEPPRSNGVTAVRLRGGLKERMRFFMLTDPAITRKRNIEGVALKSNAHLDVVSIEALGIDLPMFDITTGTGDFIANGVVSHNCFARPTHEYLDMNIGDDFDRRIVVKVNAVERLRAELRSSRWRGDHIAMGTNTDPYQRCEGKYHLTRGIVRVLAEARNPFSILTKSTLILRDLDLLMAAAEVTDVRAAFSIGTLDEGVWKATEPGTPHPRRRVEAVRKLNEAGIPCGVLVAPVLPGISDSREQLEEVVTAVVQAGALSVAAIPLHLRPGVREHFMGKLQEYRPDLVADYERRYRRAYLPKSEQQELSAVVRDIVRRAGGLPRRAVVDKPAEVTPAPQPSAEQLALGV